MFLSSYIFELLSSILLFQPEGLHLAFLLEQAYLSRTLLAFFLFFFFLSSDVLICPSFLKVDWLHTKLLFDRSFPLCFQLFKNAISPLFSLHGFWWEICCLSFWRLTVPMSHCSHPSFKILLLSLTFNSLIILCLTTI